MLIWHITVDDWIYFKPLALNSKHEFIIFLSRVDLSYLTAIMSISFTSSISNSATLDKHSEKIIKFARKRPYIAYVCNILIGR